MLGDTNHTGIIQKDVGGKQYCCMVVVELVKLGATDFKGAIAGRVEYLIELWEFQ